MGCIFQWNEAKKKFKMADIKIQNGRLKKTLFSSSANSQYFFMKFLWIGSWVSWLGWLMQRVLVWLNLYGREAVRHKLKNSLKTITYSKLCFFVQ